MGKRHHSKRGSHGFSPRVRASSPVAKFRSWPADADAAGLQGFAGYKAGMTHVLMVDYRPTSVTAGTEVIVPVTVVEAPPMRIAAVRVYTDTPYGVKPTAEAWASGLAPELSRRMALPKKSRGSLDGVKPETVDDVRVIAYTQPHLVPGVSKKVPDVMEIRVTGKDVPAKLEFAQKALGAEWKVTDFTKPGQQLDIASITKGHGFQGSPTRWGVKLQSHKNSKNRRDTTPLGPMRPPYVRPTVPMPGQTGYHQRTEYNKRVLKMGDSGAEITPKGGFLHYGDVRNPYVVIHGSLPGPAKRLVAMRYAVRYLAGVEVAEPQLTHVSTASKQGS